MKKKKEQSIPEPMKKNAIGKALLYKLLFP